MTPLQLVIAALDIVDSQPWEKASAQKQYGVYRPLVIHHNGRREFCANIARSERIVPQTKFYSGPTEVIHYKRGKYYQTRQEAVDHAARIVERRKLSMIDRLLMPNHRALRESVGLPTELGSFISR